MALFSIGKKSKKAPAPSAPGNPIDQVLMMRQQGTDNTAIIQELAKQGYSNDQIYDALNQANLGPAPSMVDGPQGMGMPQQQMPDMQMPQYNDPAPEPIQESGMPSREMVEEIAEAIIDEKWKEFEDDLRKIIDWKEQTETKMGQLVQQIQDISNSVNSLHKNILNKISEYDKNIVDVGTEIKAMEKVFQKVLPSLTENVNKLERMAKGPVKK